MSHKQVEVTISYPATKDLTFNLDYYLNSHIPLVEREWGSHGLLSWRVIKFPPGDPCGVHVQVVLRFESAAAAEKAFGELMTPELYNDLGNYSNHPPNRAVGEVLGEKTL